VTNGKSVLQEQNDLKMCDHEERTSVLETAKESLGAMSGMYRA
jgi:hypothetical protein